MPGSAVGPRLFGASRNRSILTRRGVRVLLPLAPVAGAAALAVAAGGGPQWLAVLCWLAGVAWVMRDVVLTRVGSGVASAGAVGYGRQLPLRVLLVAAATVDAQRHSPGQRGAIWADTLVVLAAVLVEPVIGRAMPRPEVAQLPGFQDSPGSRMVGLLAPAGVGVLVLAGGLGLVDAPLPVRGLLPLAAVATVALAAGIGLANWRDRGVRRVRMKDALDGYGPVFAVYTGREDGGIYQVAMWLPYLEQLAQPYVVITRRPSAVRALAAVTAAPIVARGSWRDLDDVVVPSLRAAFYVNSVASNSNFVSYRTLSHVYLGHGDSDKPLSHHPSHAMYDRVFVAGPAAIDRYARNGVHIRAEAFAIVGRPQLAALRVAPQPADRPLATTPSAAPPVVLYAPTWGGYNRESTHSSLARGADLVVALLARGVTVIFRPHPLSRSQAGEGAQVAAIDTVLRADVARTGRAHRWGPGVDAQTFPESANDSDLLVADMSSVVVDYLGADKPMAILAVGEEDAEAFRRRHPVARGAYVLRVDLADLAAGLDAMLGPDPLRAEREATRDYYLGGLDGPGAVAAFLAAARDAVEVDGHR